MELNESDKNGMEKTSNDHLNFQSPDWPFAHFPCENSIPVSSSCSSVPMVNSFCPNIWVHPSSPNAVFSENTIQATTSNSNMVASQRSDPNARGSGMERPLKADWNPRNIMPKGVYFPTGTGVLPPSLPEFPADSEFIERAARFSCFNSRNFNDIANSFGISESVSPYSGNGGIHATKDLPSNSLNLVSCTQSEELRTNDVPKDISSPFGRGVTQRSLVKNQNGSGRFLVKPSDEGKQFVGISSNESDEPEFSGEAQEEPSNLENTMLEPSNEGVCTKRKRSSQATQLDQVNENPRVSPEMTEDKMETVQNGEQNQTSSSHTPNGKCRKDSSPNSDAPKEDYIHVRARRGQATNSHSLAERVRREKISERMKFLQDLVPGCSKVTGKAVMLDEIINYVQSLQRQVEFLSMKLATVNPNPDFNIERLLPKDILQSRNGISSIFGFSPGISRPLPHLHPSQQGPLPVGIPCIGSPSDGLRRNINSQMTTLNGYREPQMSNAWDDEFQSVFQMSFGATVPSSAEDLNGSLPQSNMKVEL